MLEYHCALNNLAVTQGTLFLALVTLGTDTLAPTSSTTRSHVRRLPLLAARLDQRSCEQDANARLLSRVAARKLKGVGTKIATE